MKTIRHTDVLEFIEDVSTKVYDISRTVREENELFVYGKNNNILGYFNIESNNGFVMQEEKV